MTHQPIPKTELAVSPLCLGGANLGVRNTEAEAFALLDAFVERGGNFIDTARVYSDWVPGEKHRSERILGDWMAARGSRGRIVLATKGGHPVLGTTAPRTSRDGIAEDLDGSLTTLRADVIDLYWLHRDDPARPVADLLESLESFRAAGRIRYYGCSNWSPERIAEARAAADRQGFPGFVANQPRWSLASAHAKPPGDATMRAMDAATHALHRALNLAAIPYSSQAGGFFTKLAADPASVARSGYNTEGNRAVFASASRIAADLGVPVGHVALAWLRAQPFPVVPIVGCRTIAQLEDSIAGASFALPPDAVRQLDALAIG